MIKVLFDENFGKPLVVALEGLLKQKIPPPEISHVNDFYSRGTSDLEWIPKIAEEGWVIISADRAKRSGGPKLPLLCNRFSVTHILLSAKIHQQKQVEKILSVAAVWSQIEEVFTYPKGSQFILRQSGGSTPRPILTPKYLKAQVK